MPRKPVSRKARPKTTSSRSTSTKSSKRVAPITRRQFRVSPERKMDIIGVLVAAAGLLMLLSFFSTQEGLVTTWISTALRQLAGWGAVVISAALLLTGLWLVFRHAERFPRISAGRITGVILLYLNLLGWFGYAVPGFDAAAAGSAGGYLGGGIYWLLSQALGRPGAWFALAAGTIIAVVFIVDLSVPEIASRIGALFGKLPRPAPRPQLNSEANALRKSKPQPTDPLPEGFAPIDYTGTSAIDRAAAGLRRHSGETVSRTPAAARVPQSTKDTTPEPVVAAKAPEKPWTIPAVDAILDPATPAMVQTHFDKDRARTIEETLASFGAPAHVVEIHRGPTVTQFGVEPDFIETRGSRMRVRVSKIVSLSDDLALALAAPRIRIQAPVPGRSYVGIEVPNTEISRVALREVIESEPFRKIKSNLKFALGKDVAGKPICADLTNMPHLLIAGTTNSGKSVCVNAILSCLLLNNTPDDLRLVLVDPKRVELTGYNGIPHLLGPVVVEAEKVVGALQWMLHEMDLRYKRFASAGARNITEYNKLGGEHLPYLVVVIDELADLMMLAPEETERSITRLAQLARATGIHLIIATQRPSVDVVTGLIKANFPARIAFAVASGVDSRVILDQPGAEKLLGKGDMLFQAPDASSPVRLQGAYVADGEIQRLVENWRLIAMNDGGNAQLTEQLIMDTGVPGGVPLKQGALFGDSDGQQADPMLKEAVELVRREGRASISMLQRRLRVGYTRAARLIDSMEDQGIIGPQVIGSQVREVLDYGQTVPPREE